jgi:hypothetical protein
MKQIKYLLLIAILIMISNNSVSADNKEIIKNKEVLNNITLGVIVSGNNPEEEFKKIKELGFSYCQLGVAEYTPELAKRLRESIEKYKVQPSVSYPGNTGKRVLNGYTRVSISVKRLGFPRYMLISDLFLKILKIHFTLNSLK